MKVHWLDIKGLRSVISHLENHPKKTHLVAVKGPTGIHELVVTPRRNEHIVAELRKMVPPADMHDNQHTALVQTL